MTRTNLVSAQMKSPRTIAILAIFLIRTAIGAVHPLAPLDTSSPRATLSEFLEAADAIGRTGVNYRERPDRENFLQLALSLIHI